MEVMNGENCHNNGINEEYEDWTGSIFCSSPQQLKPRSTSETFFHHSFSHCMKRFDCREAFRFSNG
jgi:hypothetical protein